MSGQGQGDNPAALSPALCFEDAWACVGMGACICASVRVCACACALAHAFVGNGYSRAGGGGRSRVGGRVATACPSHCMLQVCTRGQRGRGMQGARGGSGERCTYTWQGSGQLFVRRPGGAASSTPTHPLLHPSPATCTAGGKCGCGACGSEGGGGGGACSASSGSGGATSMLCLEARPAQRARLMYLRRQAPAFHAGCPMFGL